jgi:hypothetical protein
MGMAMIFEGMKLLRDAGEILEGLKGAKIAKEHLDLLRTKLEFLGEEKAKQEEKAREMEDQIAQLQQELATHREFRFWRGAKWRRLPNGRIDLAVYCGACAKPAHKTHRVFGCACGWHSTFPAHTQTVIKLLGEVSEIFGDAFDAEMAAKSLNDEPEENQAARRVLSTGVGVKSRGW